MTDVIINDTRSAFRRCYHTKEDCGQLSDETQTVSKEKAERMSLRLCKHCDGVDRSTMDFSTYEKAKAYGEKQ